MKICQDNDTKSIYIYLTAIKIQQINVLQSDKQPIYKTLQIVFFSPQNSYRSGHKKMLSNVF